MHSHQVTRAEPLSAEGIYARTALGATLMLRTGTTSCVDFLFEAPEITLETLEPVVQAYRDTGMRATILLGVADKPFAESLPLDDAADAAAREAAPPTLDGIMQLAHDAVDALARARRADRHRHGAVGAAALHRRAARRLAGLLPRRAAWPGRPTCWRRSRRPSPRGAGTASRSSSVLAERGTLGPAGHARAHGVAERPRHRAHGLVRHADGPLPDEQPAPGRRRGSAARAAARRACAWPWARTAAAATRRLDMLELAKMTALVHKARGGDFHRWPTAARGARHVHLGGEHLHGARRAARAGIEAGAPRRPHRCCRLDAPAFIPLHDPVRQLVYGVAQRRRRRRWSWTGAWSCATATRSGSTWPRALRAVARATRSTRWPATARPTRPRSRPWWSDLYDRVEATDLDVDSYLRP